VESTSGEETVNKDVIVMDMGHVTLKQGIVYVLLGGRERSVRLHVVREHMDQTVAFFVTVRMGLLVTKPTGRVIVRWDSKDHCTFYYLVSVMNVAVLI
jgi:hypothetical protein